MRPAETYLIDGDTVTATTDQAGYRTVTDRQAGRVITVIGPDGSQRVPRWHSTTGALERVDHYDRSGNYLGSDLKPATTSLPLGASTS